MSEMVFYTNPQSRGRTAHWMLEEIGQPYETVWMDFGPPMKSAEYLSINPMGKIPALKHDGVVITETAAICAYLADRFPEKALAPPVGHPGRAAYYRWLFFVAGPLETAVTAKALGWQVPEGRSRMVGFGSYEDTLGTLEKAVAQGTWLCGEQFTAADVFAGSNLAWGMMFGSIEKRPAFEAYVGRFLARPAFQQANRINEARMQAVKE